ncbi:hypothetical protein LPB140_10120 [Sphingorhabdus lutea]|uniref:Copper chaperone PCu(A)C n=2 Tax=Sphingorhabdus lutea TaxID=1913578 RepID=A0A1L3JD80_9SPHN|nr:hypothetical protein LPB140_10120 [Sphingorhabdus lutea]
MNIFRLFVLILVAFALQSCSQPKQLNIVDASVRLSPVDKNPSALYFTILGGDQDDELLHVYTRSAIRTEMHESKMENGMMSMEKLNTVPVPAKSKIEFKQGGKHVMLWGINLKARKMAMIEMRFSFASGKELIVETPVTEMNGEKPDERKEIGL